MDIIHNPRLYTRHQGNLMRTVVGYLWGEERLDVMVAARELTENIAILEVLAPSDIEHLSPSSCAALAEFGRVNRGMIPDVTAAAKGYELLAKWMDALHTFAKHTG